MKQQVAYMKYVRELRTAGVTFSSKFFFLQRKWCHKVRVKIFLTGTMMAKTFAHSKSRTFLRNVRL